MKMVKSIYTGIVTEEKYHVDFFEWIAVSAVLIVALSLFEQKF